MTLAKPYVRGSLATPPSLPWLLSAMTLIGVALREEKLLLEKLGKKYERYMEKTYFMLPFPRNMLPELLAGKPMVQIALYTFILVLASIPLALSP